MDPKITSLIAEVYGGFPTRDEVAQYPDEAWRLLERIADALEASVQAPIAEREELVQAIRNLHHAGSERRPGESRAAWHARKLVESGAIRDARNLPTPAVDREALARWVSPFAWREPLADGGKVIRVESLRRVDALIASGVLQDAAEVEARGLEKLADLYSPGGMTVGHYGQHAESIRARARQVREGNPESPVPNTTTTGV